jgi:two-component system sensor histidine kinase/response regulator
MVNHRVWQKAEALERLGGDEDLLRELCQIFLEESPKQLHVLRRAVVAGDADAAMRAAHSFKGELSYLGAEDATQAARALENMAQEKDLSRAAQALASLEREVAELFLSIKSARVSP